VLTLVDGSGEVVYQSSAVARLFELPPPGLVGLPVLDWVHPDDRELFQETLERATRESQARVECRLRHADGTFRFAETAVTNLLDDPAVGSFVLNTHDVSERRRLEDELRELALSDQLTGLPNRVRFLERTQRALDHLAGQPLVLCFVDLDDFKAVNDAHGHGAGDQLLRRIAVRLTEGLRPQDTVARFGGDEFALLLENTDLPGAVRVVKRLVESVSQPVDIGGTEVVTHVSIGLTSSEGRARDPDDLLAEADAAMYAAKASGRNRYDVFRPELRVAAESRTRVRADIDHALLHNEFRLHYQPIIDLQSGQRLGIEALVRWEHPEQGLLNPSHFIEHAEASGQIGPIGEWVLGAACHATSALSPSAYTSVNISGHQLRLPQLVERVREALDTSGLPARRLVLEITETSTVADMNGAIDRLHELKELGLHIALDDFGTGYSPLSHLRSFPVDILKIDRSFVRDIAKSREDRAIVRGVIDMAHRLGLRTIAEGIEEPEQLRIMTELGCDSGQGFLWTEPVPLAELATVS
jgi:diguanylate cyclase (GGDEF)-like protein/PAS domain S-box-containing protein